jgi:hypothetical protein
MELHHVFENGCSALKRARIACKPIFPSSAFVMLAVAATRFLRQTGAAMQTGTTDAALTS